MTVVTVFLAESSLVDLLTIGIVIAVLFLLIRYKVNSVWLVLGGMAIGLLIYAFTMTFGPSSIRFALW